MKKLYTLILALGIIGVFGAGALLLTPDKPARTYVGAASSALVNDLDDLFAKTEGVIPITRYGASTTASAADNTTAIHHAIADMTAGDTLYVPPGTFNVTNVVFDPPSGCGLRMEGAFYGTTTGTTLLLGTVDGTIRQYYAVSGLDVRRAANVWTADVDAIEARNLSFCKVDIRRASNHSKGFKVRGTASHGCVYNQFNLGGITSNRYGVYLTADDSGWCNENNFFGGTVWTGAAETGTDVTPGTEVYLTIVHYATHNLDNNRFYGIALEGTSPAKAAEISGLANMLFAPRVEGLAAIELTANSDRCWVWMPQCVGLASSAIADNGSNNKVFVGGQQIYKALLADGNPVVSFHNTSTQADKIILSMTGGTTERFAFDTTGYLQIKSAATGLKWTQQGNLTLQARNGDPEGVVDLPDGSLILNGSSGPPSWKSTASGLNTGWIALYQRHASSVLLGTVGATGDHFVYHADKAVVVEKITLVSDAGVAASDTDYFSFQVRNLTAAADLLSAAQTTMATGGTAIVADTAWDITPNQNATLAAGAILELQVTKTLAPSDLTRCTIFVHVRAAE